MHVLKVGVEAVAMTDETVVDVLEVAEKVLVEVSERVKVSSITNPSPCPLCSVFEVFVKRVGAYLVTTSERVKI